MFKMEMGSEETSEKDEVELLEESNYDTNYKLLKDTQKIQDISEIIERESLEKRRESLELAESESRGDSERSNVEVLDTEMKHLEDYIKSEMTKTEELHIELKVENHSEKVQMSDRENTSKGTSYNSFRMLDSVGALSEGLSERICQNEELIEENNEMISQIMNTLKQDLKNLEKRRCLQDEEEYCVNGETVRSEQEWLPPKGLAGEERGPSNTQSGRLAESQRGESVRAESRIESGGESEAKEEEPVKINLLLSNERLIETEKEEVKKEEEQENEEEEEEDQGVLEDSPKGDEAQWNLNYLNKKLKRLQKLEFRKLRKLKEKRKKKVKRKKRRFHLSEESNEMKFAEEIFKSKNHEKINDKKIQKEPKSSNIGEVKLRDSDTHLDIKKVSESAPGPWNELEGVWNDAEKKENPQPKQKIENRMEFDFPVDDENLQLIFKLNKESLFLLQSGNFKEISRQMEVVRKLRESVKDQTQFEKLVKQSIKEIRGIWGTITKKESFKANTFEEDAEEEARKLVLDRRIQTGEKMLEMNTISSEENEEEEEEDCQSKPFQKKPINIRDNLKILKQKSQCRKLKQRNKQKLEREQTIRIEQLKELMSEIPKENEEPSALEGSAFESEESKKAPEEPSIELNEICSKGIQDPLLNTIASEIKRDLDLKRINNKLVKQKMKPIREAKETKKVKHKLVLPIRQTNESKVRSQRSNTDRVPKSNYRKLFFNVEESSVKPQLPKR